MRPISYKAAALKLLRKLPKNQRYVPEKFVTDGLASCPIG